MEMTFRSTCRTRLLICALGLLVGAACGGPADDGIGGVMDEARQTVDDIQAAQAAPEFVARAELTSGDDSLAGGTVTFTQRHGGVTVTAELEGVLPPGRHGLHVHETGDCSEPGFSSAGGHFNPMDAPHGCPPDEHRHAGDLGNIFITDDGTGTLETVTDLLTVTEGPTSVVGRAVILHAGADDCKSQPTGAAGDRLACGKIVLMHGAPEGQTPASQDETGG